MQAFEFFGIAPIIAAVVSLSLALGYLIDRIEARRRLQLARRTAPKPTPLP